MSVIFPRARIVLSQINRFRILSRALASTSKMANGFPPEKVRSIVAEVADLLKERKETVCVAETVRSS